MAEAKERSDWNRTARLEVKIHNTQVTKESDCIQFKDVHPFYMQEEMKRKQEQVKEEAQANKAMLKTMLGGN